MFILRKVSRWQRRNRGERTTFPKSKFVGPCKLEFCPSLRYRKVRVLLVLLGSTNRNCDPITSQLWLARVPSLRLFSFFLFFSFSIVKRTESSSREICGGNVQSSVPPVSNAYSELEIAEIEVSFSRFCSFQYYGWHVSCCVS